MGISRILKESLKKNEALHSEHIVMPCEALRSLIKKELVVLKLEGK